MRLRKVLQVLGILALTGLVIWICWLVWLQRYVVYTREGVTFDFDRSPWTWTAKRPAPRQPGKPLLGKSFFRLPPRKRRTWRGSVGSMWTGSSWRQDWIRCPKS